MNFTLAPSDTHTSLAPTPNQYLLGPRLFKVALVLDWESVGTCTPSTYFSG